MGKRRRPDAVTRMAQVRRPTCRETGRECAGRPCVPGRAGPAACPGPRCAAPPPRPGTPGCGPARSSPAWPGGSSTRPPASTSGPTPCSGWWASTVGRGARRRRLPRDDPPRRPAGRGRLRQQGFSTGHRDVYRVVHPDGAVRHLQAWTDVERDPQGAVVKVVGATIDVTEREELLASLDVGRANLAAALELTRTGTWEYDVLAERLTWSERMYELMDRDPSSAAATGRRVPRQRAPGRHGADPRGGRGAGHLRGRPGDRLPGAAPRRLRAPRPDPDRRTPVG